MLVRRRRDGARRFKRGAVIVLVAICLVPIVGVAAIVLDGGLLMVQRRQVQAAADAAAHAAACALYGGASTSTAQGAGVALAADNGYATGATVNIPPTSGRFAGQAGYAEAVVTYNQAKLFSAIWGAGTVPVGARAVARGIFAPYSNAAVIVLDPSSAGALSASGSGRLIANSTVQVNSSNVAAGRATNAGRVQAPAVQIVGGYTTSSGGSFQGSVMTNAPTVPNPLSHLVAPNPATLSTQGPIPTYGTYTMNPGVYNGGVSIGGGMTITMNPGIYYMKGGNFSIANGATVTGSGVMIYVDNGGGQFSFQGGGIINLSPPPSGPYAGIVMFQDPASTRSISIANGSTTSISGTVYAPNAAMTVAGGTSTSQYGSQIIVKTFNISNNAVVNTTWGTGTVARRRSLCLVE